MRKTIVYADILVAINIITDYFLLKTTAFFLKEKPRVIRLLAGAVLGGFSSLWIFVPKQAVITDIFYRIAISSVMVLSCFGFKFFRRFLRLTAVLFSVSFGFAGCMAAIFYIFKPGGMVVYNSVVYFDISAIFLTVFSVLGYITVTLISALVKKNAALAERYIVDIYFNGLSLPITAISDSGNSLTDVFGISQIIITERKVIDKFGITEDFSRYRAVPCNTVSGTSLLDGYRFDKAVIHTKDKEKVLKNPILAVSKTCLDSECDAIINPEAVL